LESLAAGGAPCPPPCRNVMSLRAKIEAVVYAAEEPVTLAQLAAIFAPEVREQWQAEKAAAAEPASEEADDEDAAAVLEPDASVNANAEAMVPETFEQDSAAPQMEVPSAPAASDPAGESASEEPAPDASEAEAKRAARSEERAIREYVRKVLNELMAELDAGDRGVEIREIAGGYRMATKPEYHDAIRAFVKSLKPPMKLSLQALETLAVVAYKQPVTGPEISEIRGVESGGVLGSLLSRKLITTAGRKQVIGRPILYKTTKEFLLRFGLKDLNELPSIEEFEKMAGELADAELEPAGEARSEGGLSTSEAEQAMNDEPEDENGALMEDGDAGAERGETGESAADAVDVTTGHAAAEQVPASENAAGIAGEPEIVVPEEPAGQDEPAAQVELSKHDEANHDRADQHVEGPGVGEPVMENAGTEKAGEA
jgi:segregation and condensation protein B